MTPRFVLLFSVVMAAMLFGEWFQFLRGFDFRQWPISNWFLMVFVVLAEAAAVAIITVTVDKALPASGNRAPTKDVKQTRRGSQKYRAR